MSSGVSGGNRHYEATAKWKRGRKDMKTRDLVAVALIFSVLLASCSAWSSETRTLAAATTPAADVVEPTITPSAETTIAAAEPTATGAVLGTEVPAATATPPGQVAPAPGSFAPVGAWSGAAYMRSVTGESCPRNPVLTVTDGEFSGPLVQVPVDGVVVAADFPNEQSVGYVVSDCDGKVQMHRFETGSSGEIVAKGGDQLGLSFATDRRTAAWIGWESDTSIRLGDRIVDLVSGSVTPLAEDDSSVRTYGVTVLSDTAHFRYVTDQLDGPDCEGATLIVESRQTGERLPALSEADVQLPITEFKSNGVGGLVAWTSRCASTTSLHAARVDPATGALIEHTQWAQADSAIVFTLHVHGELEAWAASDLASGAITPLVRVDLAPDLP